MTMTAFPAESYEVSALLSQRWEHRTQLASLVSNGNSNSTKAIGLRRQLRNLVKQLQEARNRSWQQRQQSLAQSIIEASARGNWRQAWTAARQMSQASWGPRGRHYHHVPAEAPSAEEWGQALKKTGPEGGCSGEIIWESELEDIGEFMRLNQTALEAPTLKIKQQQSELQGYHLSQEQAAELGKGDFKNTVKALARRTNGFATPPWALPKDVWRMLLSGTWLLKTRAVSGSWHLRTIFEKLLTLIRFTGQVPLLWATSFGFPILKFVQKFGTKGFRLLHLLDPISKAWTAGIWQQRQFRLGPNSFGYVAQRTMEEASMLARVLTYRLCRAQQVSCGCCLM
ncbi:unnamed protein product [Polarella glacialis]|uniref:Uncharacterized protein n=2 Tax=Polarella glacialis TaxID=89957 RepID=A0A813LBM7_POLGL|nr:unnamed protein product [Polarella glacialis]